MTDASGAGKYYYDRSGKPTTSIKTVDGVNYQIDTTYDELGRVASIRYPDNETVGYDYDTGGNLTGAGGYAMYGGFNALGQAGSINYGNGVSTALQYYASNNRLYSITTNSPTQGSIQNLSYLFDNAGNISTITDLLDGSRTQTFTYDDLNRLTQAQSASYTNGTITYQYNQIGNMTYNSRVGSYTYGAQPHAVTQAGSNSYSYDANGNMQTRNGGTITYDYDNRPASIGSTAFVYDYSGQRVKKNGTVYIGKLYECLGSSCTKYIFAGSSRIASKSSSATFYYHTDHLGSSTVITNAAGNKVQETYYYPFGETRYNSGNATHYKFTGQEEDAETGLYYYGARYYDPVIGRFISADTIVPDPFYPQSLNRYSYALNNPVVIKDANGHFPFLALIAIGAFIGGASAAISGGNFGDILRGMVMGAVSAGMGFGVGTVAAPAGAIVSGMIGGATAGLIASGPSGKVGQGMLIGAITGGIAGGIGAIPFDDAYIEGLVQISTGTVVGGVASELTGGKFSQGAFIGGISAAISFAMKQASSKPKTGAESGVKAQNSLNVAKEYLIAWNYASEYGTTGEGLTENMTAIEGSVDRVFNDIARRDATVTYTTNGTHSEGSLHYSGDAVDLRTRDLTPRQTAQTTRALRNDLGPNYDVINEGNHIHVEYD
ncbi:MAG: RHS repeat-associated core domain-containing protein, partial [Alphaproteobacteria bacterium]